MSLLQPLQPLAEAVHNGSLGVSYAGGWRCGAGWSNREAGAGQRAAPGLPLQPTAPPTKKPPSGGGFLFLYFIGVSKALQQLGIVRPGSVRTAGASIGAVVQLADHPGSFGHDEFVARVGQVYEVCRAEHNCMQVLDARIAQFTSPLVERTWAGANGRACISITLADQGPDAKGASVCSYSGPDDLLSAARATCYMPGWSGVAAALPFRGRKAMDGALTQQNP
jgi:hypothetical protein